MKTKIGALAITVLMLMVAVPVVSASPVPEVSAVTYWEARENYKALRDDFEDAYAHWLNTRADFINARTAWRADKTDQTLITNFREALRTALLAAENFMVKRLEALKARVNATRGLSDDEKTAIYTELDENISWIQGKVAEIQAAENGQQLRALAVELWDYWKQVRVRIRQIAGHLLDLWVDALLQKAEAFAGRVEAKIEELKDNGVNVTEYEENLSTYNSKVTLAEQKYDAAKAKFEEISAADENNAGQLFRDGLALIREGNTYLKEAFRILWGIIADMKANGHVVTLSGSGTLVAQGDGSAHIVGTGGIKVRSPLVGTLLVSPEAEVTTDGQGTYTTLDNSWVEYQGFGSATIRGTNMTVDINGTSIDIIARGTGTANLSGTGKYRTFGENRYENADWTSAGITATLGTGETTTGAT